MTRSPYQPGFKEEARPDGTSLPTEVHPQILIKPLIVGLIVLIESLSDGGDSRQCTHACWEWSMSQAPNVVFRESLACVSTRFVVSLNKSSLFRMSICSL